MSEIAAGFADPVFDAQAIFRAVLVAMAHPGRILCPSPLPPAAVPLNQVTTAVLLALVDNDTPVWLDAPARDAAVHLKFHCGCPIVSTPDRAAFAVITAADAMPPLDAFALGSDEAPETAATLIIEIATLTEGAGLILSGPGIDGSRHVAADILPVNLIEQRRASRDLFPRGVDLLLTSGTALAGLPRSTRIGF